ncbi:MAG: DEAD/DEAH box helicase, partial [Vicinamibacteria bacterium]
IQTLGRKTNLEHFSPRHFDYIVVDEFHHAAAATYRRVIEYFEPLFLLGLTATPERTDGGDLLALCQENLVFRCDLAEGIRLGLLSPFHYFGVPDEVDYANIPWRSSRFEEEALTEALATRSRAENALEQYRARAGGRTLAFCCSTRHADFMCEFFLGAGLRVASVHSAPTSDPRARSLERLEAGELDVVFAVDIFNEGVDLPHVDTVMMLRPTESRILWLQQFGRGLRKAEGKEHLVVIDYIGNHRTFLLKAQTLFDLPAGDQHIRQQLDLLRRGEAELPQGCEVTYELEAIDILRSLLRAPKDDEAIRFYYQDFRERYGVRPSATEMYHEGYSPRSTRRAWGSWLRFVQAMGDLSPGEEHLVAGSGRAGEFLSALETTPMTRSFKMLVLLAMVNAERFPGEIAISDLVKGVRRLARRSAALQRDLGVPVDDERALTRRIEEDPVDAWVGGKGTGDISFFTSER